MLLRFFIPHGLTGIATLTIGLLLYVACMHGHLKVARRLFVPYIVFALGNALSGFFLARPHLRVRTVFQIASVFQCTLLYFAVRFYVYRLNLRFIDMSMTFLSLVCIGTLLITASGINRLITLVVWIVSVSLLTLLSYPLHLSAGGVEWMRCVSDAYPSQGEAMAFYIYVPASWGFSLILFGATLWIRKSVSSMWYGSSILLVVSVIVSTTIVAQETHMGAVSTQKLFLPCFALPFEWANALEKLLDVSEFAKRLLPMSHADENP